MPVAEQHKRFLARAIELAVEGMHANKGGPFGAVIVKDGVIIAEASNEVTSSKDVTSHAEIGAIRRACDALGTHDLSGCTLYTSCWPCPMCCGASLWARLSHVYYAADAEDALAVGFDDAPFWDKMRNGKEITDMTGSSQIITDDKTRSFDEWAKKVDRIEY